MMQGVIRHTTFITGKLNVPRLCPLDLLVNVGWRQDRALGCE